MDATDVYNLVCDPKFEDLLQNLKHCEVKQIIADAFNVLYSATGPPEKREHAAIGLHPEGCMVVTLVLQLLVRLFIKRLMNLMTTEAVILHRNMIPSFHLKNYLGNQAHFSLKEIIANYHTALSMRATIV